MSDFDNPFASPFNPTMPNILLVRCIKKKALNDCSKEYLRVLSSGWKGIMGMAGKADPSIQESRRTQPQQPQAEFNPFAGQSDPVSGATKPPVAASQPAELPPSYEPQGEQRGAAWDSNRAAVEELQRRQEELERRAAEIDKREREIQRATQAQDRRNNFPPLPSFCPLQPCFYQDISVDIPLEFQKLVKTLYYGWIAYSGLLLLNVLGSLTYFIASSSHNITNNKSGETFGLSILYFVLFTPCSFVCWFRPAYNAFRNDSSFNFFVFFFIFFFQFCVSIIQCLGLDGWGTVGFISSFNMFGKGAGATAAAVIMLLIGLLFALDAAFDIFMLIKIHRIYRSTGASFAKAQSEFAQGVMSNRTVRETTGNLAASAARNTFNQGGH